MKFSTQNIKKYFIKNYIICSNYEIIKKKYYINRISYL